MPFNPVNQHIKTTLTMEQLKKLFRSPNTMTDYIDLKERKTSSRRESVVTVCNLSNSQSEEKLPPGVDQWRVSAWYVQG